MGYIKGRKGNGEKTENRCEKAGGRKGGGEVTGDRNARFPGSIPLELAHQVAKLPGVLPGVQGHLTYY